MLEPTPHTVNTGRHPTEVPAPSPDELPGQPDEVPPEPREVPNEPREAPRWPDETPPESE